MRQKTRRRVHWLAQKLLPEEYPRLRQVQVNDLGHGYDAFGLEYESALTAFMLFSFLYRYWFRVESRGVENVPETGPALITPNHSGVLPLDGAMIGVDLALKMKHPRVMRAVVEHFFGFLPLIGTGLYRAGQVMGSRRNLERLFEAGELVCLFPEGAKGTGKLFRERYKLRRFNVGFMELSLIYQVPIIPTAVLGGEEQYPMIYDIKPIARAIRFPYFPLTATWPWLGPLGLVPLPVKYSIHYGEPFHFYRDYPPATIRDPETIGLLVNKVQDRVQEMIGEGLKERKGVFK